MQHILKNRNQYTVHPLNCQFQPCLVRLGKAFGISQPAGCVGFPHFKWLRGSSGVPEGRQKPKHRKLKLKLQADDENILKKLGQECVIGTNNSSPAIQCSLMQDHPFQGKVETRISLEDHQLKGENKSPRSWAKFAL